MGSTGGSVYDAKPYLPGYDNGDWFEDRKPVTPIKDFYLSRSLLDKLIDFVDAGETGKPFFAFLSLQAWHIAVRAPIPYCDAQNGVFDAGLDAMREARLKRAIDLRLVPTSPETHRVRAEPAPRGQTAEIRKMQANAGMMTAADKYIRLTWICARIPSRG